MKKLLSVLLLFQFFSHIHLNGQTKKIVIPHQYGSIYTGKVNDHYLYFMLGGDNAGYSNFMRLDLNTNKYETIDSNILYCQSVKFSDSGVFYISFAFAANGNDGQHYLNFYRYNGSLLNLGVINLYASTGGNRPTNISLFGNSYYAMTTQNNLHTLWMSDGSISGTKAIVKTYNPITNFTFKDKIYLWEFINNVYNLYAIDKNGTKVFVESFQTPFHNVAENDSFLFCTFNNKLKKTTNFKNFDSTFQDKFIPTGNSQQIDSILVQIKYDEKGAHLEALSLKFPFKYSEIPKAKPLENSVYRINSINGRFAYIWSLQTGNEIAHYELGDSLRLVKDLYKDYGHGARFVFPEFSNNHLNFLGSNGKDEHNYLYQTDGIKMQSFFKIDTISTDDINFSYNNSFYWCYHDLNSNTKYIFTRSFTDKDTQPNNTSSTIKNPGATDGNEWHREFSAASKQYQHYYEVRNEGVHIDKNENIIVSANIGENYHDMALVSLDTPILKALKGNEFIIKYDRDGHFLWSNSFNNTGNIIAHDARTALDDDGNVLVFGIFFQKFYYGTDSLITPRAGIYVCKLNGKDGSFVWCKLLNPTYYTNDCDIDQIIADRDGNIYLSLTYKYFSASFGNINLTADRSPVNALVKLSPDGEVLWAKNTPTSWEDIYGLTRDIVYNRAENTFYAVISQGYYNWWSSCKYQNWHTSIQKITTEGLILKTQDFKCDDLYSSVCAEITKTNELFISGFYRGQLTSNQYKVESKYNAKYGCNQFENFTAKFSLSKLDGTGLKSTDNNEFYPFDISKDKDFIYVIGSELTYTSKYQPRNLSIRKYNHSGRLLAKRIFDHPVYDVFDFDYLYNITASDSAIVMSMSSAKKIPPYTNYFGNSGGISVYRLDKTIGWQAINEYQKNDLETKMVISPNPAVDFISIQFLETGVYQTMSITDSQGKAIRQINLTTDSYQSIDLSDLSSGIYILNFNGSKVSSFKLIKL